MQELQPNLSLQLVNEGGCPEGSKISLLSYSPPNSTGIHLQISQIVNYLESSFHLFIHVYVASCIQTQYAVHCRHSYLEDFHPKAVKHTKGHSIHNSQSDSIKILYALEHKNTPAILSQPTITSQTHPTMKS